MPSQRFGFSGECHEIHWKWFVAKPRDVASNPTVVFAQHVEVLFHHKSGRELIVENVKVLICN